MAELSKVSLSSITNCLLLNERTKSSSRYQDTLMTKYAVNPLKVANLKNTTSRILLAEYLVLKLQMIMKHLH